MHITINLDESLEINWIFIFRYELKRPIDLSAEKLEELKTKIIKADQPVQTDILKANEILDENLDQTKSQSKLSRLMLPQG